jgi:hypothetical protein
VIDAVAACGFSGGYPEQYGKDRPAVLWLERQPEREQERILRLAYSLERYGL